MALLLAYQSINLNGFLFQCMNAYWESGPKENVIVCIRPVGVLSELFCSVRRPLQLPVEFNLHFISDLLTHVSRQSKI